jgi:hypothetical protein
MWWPRLCVIACVCTIAGSVRADESEDVKATARDFAAALASGDATAAKAVAISTDKADYFIDSMSLSVKAYKRLAAAAAAKFGEDAKSIAAPPLPKWLEFVGEMNVTLLGTQATMARPGDDKEALYLKRVGTQWKLDLDGMAQADHPEQVARMALAADAMAQDIKSGKYASAREVQRALEKRLLAVTRPSTEPATRPKNQTPVYRLR